MENRKLRIHETVYEIYDNGNKVREGICHGIPEMINLLKEFGELPEDESQEQEEEVLMFLERIGVLKNGMPPQQSPAQWNEVTKRFELLNKEKLLDSLQGPGKEFEEIRKSTFNEKLLEESIEFKMNKLKEIIKDKKDLELVYYLLEEALGNLARYEKNSK